MRTAREIFESLIEDEKRNERRNRRFDEDDEPVRRHGRISESRYDRQSMRDIREARERRANRRSLSDIYESARRQRAIDEEEEPIRRHSRVSESLYDAVRRQRRINESQEKKKQDLTSEAQDFVDEICDEYADAKYDEQSVINFAAAIDGTVRSGAISKREWEQMKPSVYDAFDKIVLHLAASGNICKNLDIHLFAEILANSALTPNDPKRIYRSFAQIVKVAQYNF